MNLSYGGVIMDVINAEQAKIAEFARAIVQATADYKNYELMAKLSKGIGTPMKGLEISKLATHELMASRSL